jgi:CheY-like chemotaxis protein
MPIVDGLTSTKMIRSFEKSHPTHVLSKRAALNGRIPVIAVSASLIEKDRQNYVNDGFDGWILKPISFDRLKHIMLGIVDPAARKDNIYKAGGWERGGWFGKAKKDIYAADTKPNEKPPMTAPSEGVKNAASSDDPCVRKIAASKLRSRRGWRMRRKRRRRRKVQTQMTSLKAATSRRRSLPWQTRQTRSRKPR